MITLIWFIPFWFFIYYFHGRSDGAKTNQNTIALEWYTELLIIAPQFDRSWARSEFSRMLGRWHVFDVLTWFPLHALIAYLVCNSFTSWILLALISAFIRGIAHNLGGANERGLPLNSYSSVEGDYDFWDRVLLTTKGNIGQWAFQIGIVVILSVVYIASIH